VADLLFCPVCTATSNLRQEGITKGVWMVGNIMVNALSHKLEIAETKSRILETLDIRKGNYAVATIHRPGNTDSRKNLTSITVAFRELGETIIFPVIPGRKNT
jgi:UDP-N-acetylglucosamine 2-epimerase (non-hydrolysing)